MNELKRSLNLFLITFYGIGTILGAGIYVLIGEVAAAAGMYAPLSFLLAAVISGLSAVSYMELSARYPVAAGEAAYVHAAFNSKRLSQITGWLVAFAGIISSATISKGFIGYLNVLYPSDETISIILLVAFMVCISIWGAKQSVGLASAITLLEIGGLLLIIYVAGDSFSHLPERSDEFIPPLSGQVAYAISLGCVIAFYAFIGFEDIVNMAEEVENPERNLPLAIIISVVVSSFLYMLVAVVALLSLPLAELSNSKAPMADIFVAKSTLPPALISVISLVAVVNGALIQMIMASRVLYGLAKRDMASQLFAVVSNKTHTPWLGIGIIGLCVLLLALWFPLGDLAVFTSFMVLMIFLLVNLSLLSVRYKAKQLKEDHHKTYPIFFPLAGVLACLFLIGIQLSAWA